MSNAKQARQTTMNRPTLWICGAAVLLATMTLEAQATTLEWNVDANGSLGDAANWNPQAVPSASHDVLLGTIITAARTINVGQTAEESSIWTINSLSVAANATASYRFNWEASPNKTLVVSSGVLSAGGGGPLHHLTTVSDGAFPDRVQLRIPDGLSPTWPIAGDLRIGPLRGDPDNGYSAGTTISKNGTGMLVMAGQSGDFRGALTVAEGSLRIESFAVHNNLGNLRIEPAHGSDVRLEGGGALRLASGKHVVLAGTTSAEAVVSPGDGAAIGMLTLGSTDGDVSFEDYSRLTVTLHAIAAGSSDTLEVRGRLNLGAPDTANILDIQLQDPNQPLSGTYTLASYVAGLTGTFGAIYYDGELVTDPATAIGDTGYQLVYGGDAVLLKPVEAILVASSMIADSVVAFLLPKSTITEPSFS